MKPPLNPVAVVHKIAAKLPATATRAEIIAACVKRGINRATAGTQASKFLVEHGRNEHRSKAQMTALRERLIAAAEAQTEARSVRAYYYLLAALTPATEPIAAYNTIQQELVTLREEGEVPWDKVIDSTRHIEFPNTWSSLAAHLASMATYHRRELWDDSEGRVVVTCEKDALANWIRQITNPADVPYLTLRGYASVTVLHDLSEWIQEQDQHIHVYHFGDWNPSGENIQQHIQEKLTEYGADNFTLRRGALTEQQIKRWKLGWRPAKDTDSRTPTFSGKRCTDLDALSKAQLQGLVKACIAQHVDRAAVQRIEREQTAERKQLAHYAQRLARAPTKVKT